MEQFEQLLKTVPQDEYRILQILSLYLEQINSTDFYKLLRNLEVRSPANKYYSGAELSEFRHKYVKKGILENTREYWGPGFQISTEPLREFLTRDALKEPWAENLIRDIELEFPLPKQLYGWNEEGKTRTRLLRNYRFALYRKDFARLLELREAFLRMDMLPSAMSVAVRCFSNPFQSELLSSFEKPFQVQIIANLLLDSQFRLESTDDFWEFVSEHELGEYSLLKSLRLREFLLKGEIDVAENLLKTSENFSEPSALGVIAYLRGEFEQAKFLFEEGIRIWRADLRKKKGFPDDWKLFFYGLSLIKTNPDEFHKFAEEFAKYGEKNYPQWPVTGLVRTIALFLKNNNALAEMTFASVYSEDPEEIFLTAIVAAIVPYFRIPSYMSKFEADVKRVGLRWVEMELQNLFSTKSAARTDARSRFDELNAELGFTVSGNIVPRLEEWERALSNLLMVAKQAGSNAASNVKIDETRLVWLINFERRAIQPVEQKFGKTGWSSGRNVSLKRMFDGDFKNLNEQDSTVVKKALKKSGGYYYGGYDYQFDWEKAMTALVGHPLLFLMKNPKVGVQLEEAEPALVIKKVNDDFALSFDTKFEEVGCLVEKETETRFRVVQISKFHVEIASSMPDGVLRIPADGREKLVKAIQPLSARIAIQSDLEEHFEALPTRDAENRIHALITPAGDAFHLELFVKPFGSVPPYFKPGKGNESVVTDIEGIRTRVKRELESERALLNEVEAACPYLAGFESPNYEWTLESPEACLTAMLELEEPRKADKLVVEWTKGQKLKLAGTIGFDNFSMTVKGKNKWFEVEGTAKVSDDLVLSMQEITKLLQNNSTNFIELSDGQFVAITEKLRKHLQAMGSVLDDKQQLFNLRSGILEDFGVELADFQTDKAWKEHLRKIKESRLFQPELPRTFEADLRPYQVEGFEWVSRLANWGVGACLADDMGLGKTLMALAALVERADKGPALVVAPVSVCRNWVKEAARFAPTLNLQVFGAGDRKAIVEGLGKYDVLVTSYNLLQTEEALFAEREFATVVLDEAQAVKNRNTKRSKAVMALKADFRLITTGTPIENHLGELWNLFNFLNPGLLGNHEFFNEKFAVPIEKNDDDAARKTLQRLIRPFILRRRKNQVLDDLPEKTEIMLTVEMSAEERAFYEALRRDALQRIESEGGAANDKRFRILAELTKLRLACCHPKLVNPEIPLSSSKLELFGEVLEELLDNKHKALVFSQFVKHLAIIEKYLDEKKIPYYYLDGSTPAHIRQERIDAFQRGEGEVFLISLKAGGTGLNLTAADYVIHLDPWWNPAVEDQATDRVHRIGQQRPVTVYRLVTENTVEEKILKLHETKRDLADGLLEGSDSSGKLSADDLLALISEV